MDEQAERKAWTVYTTGKDHHDEEVSVVSGDDYICLVVDIDDNDLKYREAMAQQIADDHNRIPVLEAQLAEAQASDNMNQDRVVRMSATIRSAEAENANLREALQELVGLLNEQEEANITADADEAYCDHCGSALVRDAGKWIGHEEDCWFGLVAPVLRKAKAAL